MSDEDCRNVGCRVPGEHRAPEASVPLCCQFGAFDEKLEAAGQESFTV